MSPGQEWRNSPLRLHTAASRPERRARATLTGPATSARVARTQGWACWMTSSSPSCPYRNGLGYIQGLSDLLSAILCVTQNEVAS